jgi:ribosomal-protein-alanine N-acetyltransferase
VAVIRDFRRAEFLELWRIDQACFEPHFAYSQKELAWYMSRPGAFTLVAENDGATAGFVTAAPLKQGSGHIITIDVVEDARRSGVGSELLRAAEERLRTGGCERVQLEVSVSNTAAIRFYQRHGYGILRTLPRYYNGELDALLMEKLLG